MGKEDESFRAAFDVWQDKTDWVQKDRRFDVLNPWGMHRADVLKAFIEHLEGRITELELDCAEYLKFKEVMEMASQHLANDEPLDLESLFRGELASAMFSMMFAGEFKRSGATNYLELSYDVPEFGGVIVTIQKQDGKTPGQRIGELEERIAELESRTVTVKLPKPHAHLIWIQAGHAPDDYWDDVAVSHSEKDRCCDGSERYPVYARWEIEEMLTAAGIKVEAE
ncbi:MULTISPECIES: hypothetical protein [Klebsiella]|uniref:hypothetical protein n=1 Tax=Klebsiella TaxID=570 RepID=UPI002166C196|nr:MULTISPECIES: hypothetical protein [Klebsiella]MCS4374484.1 hypothetical protein [Klebsiella quasipneumoniae subsp. similipneumoniae]MCS4418657.1 hypothetical protein [Klebsiella quasipneumoniae subsp. similipneumoniae]MDK1919755.1 hypothetical protein [Klebsiella sp. K4-74]